jgi:hypothetical protein
MKKLLTAGFITIGFLATAQLDRGNFTGNIESIFQYLHPKDY